MSPPTELHPSTHPVHDGRKVLGLGGNRTVAKVPRPTQKPKNKPKPRRKITDDSVVSENGSVVSLCSTESSSSSSSSSVKTMREEKPVVKKCSFSRCDWITSYCDPIYVTFHDKEWGVPTQDDDKLFELLCFCIALAEHSWESILYNRDVFRKRFNGFNVASVAQISEETLSSIVARNKSMLSEPRVRAIVNNAKLILQIQKQFGSFNNYCWKFMNNKPQKNGYRHQRQMPVKTPKAELISKDLMDRGFRCVGPIVVYSFMQASGMVNDHLTTCFRYQESKS